jgi:hypothetical protein
LAVTTAPVPIFRSFLTNDVGGGPVGMGTAGAPDGSGSETATHGFPRADATSVVGLVRANVGVVEVALPLPLDPHAASKNAENATTATV